VSEGLISCIIPVFNEAESLPALLAELEAMFAKLPGSSYEIIFVDDGSTDATWDTVKSFNKCTVKAIRFRRNFGKAAALQAGFAQARGEVVFTLDADLQDDPAEIPSFLAKLEADKLDVVSGYKQVRHDPWHKVLPSRVFNGLVSTLTGVKLHDHNCGFKCYRHAVVKNVKLYGELHRFVPVLAAAQGYRVGEKVVQHRPRKFGRSKFGWQRFLKGFLDLLQVAFLTRYGRRPMHFFGTLALLIAIVSVLLAFGLVLAYLFTSWVWLPSVLLILMLCSGGAVVPCLLCGLLAELIVTTQPAPANLVQETSRTDDAT
jgi:glycosyltransferase involved in cell wall biosynthesis